MKNYRQYNANSTDCAAMVIRRIAPSGKAATATIAALLALTISLGTGGCSRSKANNQGTTSIEKPPTESVASQIPAPALAAPAAVSQPQVAKKKSVQGPVRKVSSTLTYSSDSAGISFKYPRNAKLLSGTKAESESVLQRLPMNFVQPGGTVMVALELPESSKVEYGSQLFTVNINQRSSAEECGRFAMQPVVKAAETSPDDTADKPVLQTLVYKQTIQGIDYAEFDHRTEQGAVKYYHRFVPESESSGFCYEFGMAVRTAEEKHDSENTSTSGSAERKNVFMKLEKILASVNITALAADGADEKLKTATKLEEGLR